MRLTVEQLHALLEAAEAEGVTYVDVVIEDDVPKRPAGRAYSINAEGRVVDTYTGEELEL